MKLFLYHLVAFLVVAIWGSTFVFTKLLLLNGFTPAQIFTLRFFIAYVLLSVYEMLFRRKKHRTNPDSLKDWLVFLGLGITGGSLYFLSENEALNYTTTTNVSLIVCCCPLAAALLIGMFYKSQRVSMRQMVGMMVAVCGVAAVILNGHFVLHLSPLGDALALTANLCWAVYSLLIISANKKYDAMFVTRKVFFYGLITMLPYFWWRSEELPTFMGGTFDAGLLLQPKILANLMFLSVVASCLCFLLWTWVMDKLGAMVATNYVYVNPLTTIIVAWLVLNEQITAYFVVGAILILVGMYLADKKSVKKST